MNKQALISILVTIGASADTIYQFITDNQGLLNELFGLSPKVSKIIMLIGLLYTAFSKPVQKLFAADEPIIGDRPKDR